MSNRKKEEEIAKWVVQSCLLFEASIPTAYNVAAVFVKGLQDEQNN
jgi:hypothetical protein